MGRYDQFSYSVQYDWARLHAYVAKVRAEAGMPEVYEHFEWLADQMAKMDREKAHEVVFDDAYLAARLAVSLDLCRDQIRFFERSRVVYVRDAPVAEPPAASVA